MSERIIYLNGDYIAESEAKLPVFDRGLLFADAVYEGFGILEKMRGMLRETDVAAPDNVKSVDSTSQEKLYERVADPRYAESPSFRAETEKMFENFYGKQAQNQVRQ